MSDSQVVRVVRRDVLDGSYAATPALPAARLEINIRLGVLNDYPFIDALQKANKRGVGFMFESAVKGHLEKGNVLIAEDIGKLSGPSEPVGYVIGVDRYLKRDELGIIYQMCVVPEHRRSLVAANLLKTKFESSAYGCRLYCCWCAQDLAANKFWEAMGFIPLAFRTGGGRRKKDGPRMHIFWQKRIREGDSGDLASGGTPYWFPSQTGAGAIGEDRLVLPIPPGTHWSDAKPVVLPNGPVEREESLLLEAKVDRLTKAKKLAARCVSGESGRKTAEIKPKKVTRATEGGLHFGERPKSAQEQAAERCTAQVEAKRGEVAAVEAELKAAKKALRRERKKFDPEQVAFARELKDRWLEQVQAQPGLLAAGAAKYSVARRIEATMTPKPGTIDLKRLDAA